METLPDHPLFRNLEPADASALTPLFEPFACSAGNAVFKQGDLPDYLYLILKGSVVIQYKPYDGCPIRLARLREGDAFGWSAVIGSQRYTATIVSETPLKCIRIRGADLQQIAARRPALGKTLIDRLAHMVSPRWARAQEQIQALLSREK